MDSSANTDFNWLSDEKLDFDVSISSGSSNGDEDEVWAGPVCPKQRCVRVEDGGGWGPLTGDQLEAVCQEASQLAGVLQRAEPAAATAMARGEDVGEEFIQDATAKLGVLGRPANVLTPIKRQTFCVQDSPMKELPDIIQRRAMKENRTAVWSAVSKASTSSSVGGTKPQLRSSLRGKSGLCAGAVLPSKPSGPAQSIVSRKMSETEVKKSRLQRPIRVGGASRSSSAARLSSRTRSADDLLSDASDSSLNSSCLGKRGLPPPTKSITRNLSTIKPLTPQSRSVTNRRRTSSSSSSVSSINSSLSASPAPKVKANPSLNVSVSGSSCRAPPSVSRPSNGSISTAKSRRSTVYSVPVAPPAGTAGGRRSSSLSQPRKPCEDGTKPVRSTPLKRAESALPHLIPSKRGTERTASYPGSAQKATANGLTGVVSSPDVSRILRSKRLMSAGSVQSLQHNSERPPVTPADGNRVVQLRTPRPSALPTPLRRRTSSIPMATPSRLDRPSLHCDPAPTSAQPTSAQTQRECSPALSEQEEEETFHPPDIQPFCLEEEKGEEPIFAQPSTSPQSGQSDSLECEMLSGEKAEPERNRVEVKSAEEVLLFGLPPPSLQPQEKLLIDLRNTPDLIRTNKICSAAQLIDLSSPLIKWSPDDKKENEVNEAPLINLSF
ncbi:G2 and S phase-expressed protein 1 isoform X2 [Genypterus blacodes]|uniref:G2 and S phase-expressed protein 1 isoform X2 n=1 Tax=Genypterus blacodes TaxID=154954 RepID=UPI003F7591A8